MQIDPRKTLAEFGQAGNDKKPGQCFRGAESDAAFGFLFFRAQIARHDGKLFVEREQHFGQLPALVGENDAGRGWKQELGANLILEPVYLPADLRLADPQCLGRPVEGLRFGYRKKCTKFSPVGATEKPAIIQRAAI